MRSQGRRTQGRGRRIVVAAVAAALIPLLGPTGAQAEKANVGAGIVLGSVEFTNGTGIPPVGEGCEFTTFELVDSTAQVFAMNTVITGYLGEVELTGTGASTNCEDAGGSVGTLALSATGTGPTGSRIDCGPLTGEYTRVLAEVTVAVRGDCTINNFGTGVVEFLAALTFHPTNEGGGVTDRVTHGDFAGAFVVVPALS